MKMMMIALTLVTGFASAAQADYRCSAYSNGRSFSETRNSQYDAERATVNECKRAPRTNNRECQYSVSCNYVQGNDYPRYPYPYPTPPRGGGHRAPPVRAGLCFVAQTNEWVDGDRFFSLVSNWANRNNRCATAKISYLPYSGRIYDRNGSRVGTHSGMSNSEVDRTLRAYGLWGCEEFSCREVGY